LFARDLLDQILPLVERRYRVQADADHRAIGGLSASPILNCFTTCWHTAAGSVGSDRSHRLA
jgi:predicted alpha/beta superfamily hydrolase